MVTHGSSSQASEGSTSPPGGWGGTMSSTSSATRSVGKSSPTTSPNPNHSTMSKPSMQLRFEDVYECFRVASPASLFHAAGKRAGTSDDRYLWPEMFRIIREARPTYVVAENVRGLISWNEGMVLDTVCADLEGEGYEVFPVVLPAASVNAPHRRDRIWIVAHSNNIRGNQPKESKKQQGRAEVGATSAKSCRFVAHAHDQRGAGGPRQVQGTHGEVPQRDDHAEPCHAGAADATNTAGGGVRGDAGELCQAQRRQDDELNAQPFEHGTTRSADATNANGAGERQDNPQGEPRQPYQKSAPRDWQDFPTVAPVCGGNDGLPERLDNITFPKWRRESIKAYGNAIVPQVAFQIFQALNE